MRVGKGKRLSQADIIAWIFGELYLNSGGFISLICFIWAGQNNAI